MVTRANVSPRSAQVTKPATPDHELCARLVVREGKSFKEAAIAAGYAETSARRGLKGMISESSALSQAVRREWLRLESDVTQLKPLAAARLYKEIVDYDSPHGMRAIEIAGKFRETDWFVRSSPDIQIGIVNAIADTADTTLTEYKDTESSE